MQERITRPGPLRGRIRLPGDKSISHRYAILGALAHGETRIRHYSSGADCASTLGCLSALGVPVEKQGSEVRVQGSGVEGFRAPEAMLNAGNSGSTIRMLSGVLAGLPFDTRIAGDESLARRPMDRIMRPLAGMGASIDARDGRYPPLAIHAARLHGIDYTLPVASAQVKTCLLLAGLNAEGETVVRENVPTRDHTEVALREFGAAIRVDAGAISVRGGSPLAARDLDVPGDLSSAAFFLAAALMVPGSNLVVERVGLNPTRSALLDFLLSMGADVKVLNRERRAGEVIGDIEVCYSLMRGGTIEKALTAALIDEIPVLAVLGAMSEEGLVVRDAAELRLKETDRIATVGENLRRMGVNVELAPDGFRVPGRQRFHGAEVDSFGDHRIAMAFAVAGLAADGETVIQGAEAAAVSYPEFFATLRQAAC
jgi:3-phosphoshikimate 1-carboxyvinyltransferase